MKVLLKWIVAWAALAGGGWLFYIPVDSEAEPYRALGYAAGGLVLVAVAAGIAIVPVGRWLADVMEMIFFPSGGHYTPPALYKLPQWMIKQGRYGDALAEYEKILKHHPQDVAAYEGRLFVLYSCLGNTVAAEKLFKQALRRMPAKKREELQAYMESLRAGSAQVPQRSQEA